jgi:hypothetical protein
MPRPANKEALLSEGQRSFDELLDLVASIAPNEAALPGVNGQWSVKDVLAHLHAWHKLMEIWYAQGMAGKKPAIPAAGHTWKTTPQLNDQIFRDHRADAQDLVLKNLRASHSRIRKLITRHSQSELFTKKKYAWTGTTSMGSYFVGATSSHYQWAIDLIKRWLKSRNK